MRPLLTILFLTLTAGLAIAQPPASNDIRAFAGVEQFAQQSGLRSQPAADAPDLTPEQLERAYSTGFVGAFIDDPAEPDWARQAAREGEREFEAAAGVSFAEAFPPEWRNIHADVDRAVYWNYALRFDGDPIPVFKLQQATGNCVAASALDVSLTHCYGVAIFLLGREIEWRGPGATVHYAFRGHCGQGANLGTIAAAIAKHGFAARTVYGSIDLRDTRVDQNLGQSHCRNPEQTLAELWRQTKDQPIGRVARFDGGLPELLDLLAAGGSLQTGGRITASKDGRPISRQASVGPHAQSIIGFDNSAAMKERFRINEPIFFFSQTWGDVRYIQEGWVREWWGTAPQGCFILPWSVVQKMLPGSYAYWPDLTGFSPTAIPWKDVRRN